MPELTSEEKQQALAQYVHELTEGNAGALSVVMMLIENYRHHPDRLLPAKMLVLVRLSGLRGPAIWLAYKDKCGFDLEEFVWYAMREAERLEGEKLTKEDEL